MSQNILVTGATGKIGSRVVRGLTKDTNIRVLAGVRDIEKAKPLADAGAHLIELDLANVASVEAAVASADKIFLLTPFNLEMVAQQLSVVTAALSTGVKQIVKLSAMGAEWEPTIHLGQMHRSVEREIMGDGIPFTFLRPNGFMQNFEMNASTIKTQGIFYMPLQNAKVSWISVDDIADVAVKILLEPTDVHIGRDYQLTGNEALSCDEIAGLMSDMLEKDIEYMSVPDEAAVGSMVSAGMPKLAADYLIELFQQYRTHAYSHISHSVPGILGRAATTFEHYLATSSEVYK